ncbi:MAG: twin-arginine translocase TatA/TatE family subunit [Deltaproteobacteria bacterium]|nr:twin-arginine translocase TatA/TatE family subunit [Deltaproteobacteria bacterium]
MFGIGTGELIIIAAIGVIVLGPEKCLSVFRDLGKLWRNVRAEMAQVKSSLDHQLHDKTKK